MSPPRENTRLVFKPTPAGLQLVTPQEPPTTASVAAALLHQTYSSSLPPVRYAHEAAVDPRGSHPSQTAARQPWAPSSEALMSFEQLDLRLSDALQMD